MAVSTLSITHSLHPGKFLLLIFIIGRVDPRGIVWLEGVGKLKNPNISSGLETVSLLLVSLCFITNVKTINTELLVFGLVRQKNREKRLRNGTFFHLQVRGRHMLCWVPREEIYFQKRCVLHFVRNSRWTKSKNQAILSFIQQKTKSNSVALVRERTIPPLVGLSTFADRGCHVVSKMNPYAHIPGFLYWSRYFLFHVAPQLYSRGLVDPVPDLLLLIKYSSVGNRTRTSGSVARNSDH
jgi:hypothetical protein